MRRLAIATTLAAAAFGAAACTQNNEAATAPPDHEIEAAQVEDQCAGPAAFMPGAVGQQPEKNAALCGDIARGQHLADLSEPSRIDWDKKCLASHRYTLGTDETGNRVPVGPDGSTSHAQDVAPCGTPKYTAEQCTRFQSALGAVDSRTPRGVVIDYRASSVLDRLGCAVPGTNRQAGLKEAQS